MKTAYDYRIILTEHQEAILEQAIELLRPYNKEEVSHEIAYFESVDTDGDKSDDLDLIEYDTCNNDSCVLATLSELQQKYPEYKIKEWYMDNNGDHDSIDSCYRCGRPLNEFMTWIRQEFEHHQEHSLTKNDLTESRTAFDIIAMLQSFPSNDYEIGGYAIKQNQLGNQVPLQESIKRRDEFINQVMAFAENIIKELK